MQTKNLLFLGAGVMSSSISVPAADNGHSVCIAGSPLDRDIIELLKQGKPHPKLDNPLPSQVTAIFENELQKSHFEEADVILLGVNCLGVDWALDKLRKFKALPQVLALITKGVFEVQDQKVLTIPEYIDEKLTAFEKIPSVIGIAGPCIARELANRLPTLTVFGYRKKVGVDLARQIFETDYYQIRTDPDLTGIEVNAALKNFMTIGITTTWSRYPETKPSSVKPRNMNPTAAFFAQAVREMVILTSWLGGNPQTAYELAGIGDLFVTVNAGRNSSLGLLLGENPPSFERIKQKLKTETIEGAVVAANLKNPLEKAIKNKVLHAEKIPLTLAIIDATVNKNLFKVNFNQLFCNGYL